MSFSPGFSSTYQTCVLLGLKLLSRHRKCLPSNWHFTDARDRRKSGVAILVPHRRVPDVGCGLNLLLLDASESNANKSVVSAKGVVQRTVQCLQFVIPTKGPLTQILRQEVIMVNR